MGITIEDVRAALELRQPEFDSEAAQLKMAPHPRPLRRALYTEGLPRLAATLLLLYPKAGELHFILTRRPDTLTKHPGQISLPGGRQESGETFIQAALRETCEEVGICGDIEVIGSLAGLYIPPSDYQVYPFVGYHSETPDTTLQPTEVVEIIETPLAWLLDDGRKEEGEGRSFRYRWYNIKGHRVWGATAIMLSEMEWRLRAHLATAR